MDLSKVDDYRVSLVCDLWQIDFIEVGGAVIYGGAYDTEFEATVSAERMLIEIGL